jgi:hypothetical protein
MSQGNWIVHLILGIIFVGILLLGLAFASIFILPGIAVLAIVLPLYFLIKNRARRGKKDRYGKKEQTVSSEHYVVLDEKEEIPHKEE